MDRGLVISEQEKASSHTALHRVVTTHTSHTWAVVLAKTTPPVKPHTPPETASKSCTTTPGSICSCSIMI
ncbi:hypothetical protein EDB19DRAFT_1751772, partial [Suillus lakei]